MMESNLPCHTMVSLYKAEVVSQSYVVTSGADGRSSSVNLLSIIHGELPSKQACFWEKTAELWKLRGFFIPWHDWLKATVIGPKNKSGKTAPYVVCFVFLDCFSPYRMDWIT